MLSIFSVLCEMVAMVSLSRAHTTLSRHQSHHITDGAGQTRLLVLVISCLLCV